MLNFKIYNDVMGYSEGDALLKAFARILEREAPRPMPAAEFTELLAGEGGHAER